MLRSRMISNYNLDICTGMKRIWINILWIIFIASSCGERCEKAEGPRSKRQIPISDATSLVLDFVADITIRVDSSRTPLLNLIAQDAVLDMILAENQDNELTLTLDGCIKENDPILFECELPQLNNIELNSAGKIQSGLILLGDELRFTNNGLGEIDFVVNAKRIIGEVKSSGDLRLAGSTEQLDFLTTSSGDLRAFDLVADTLNLHMFGSTVCDVYSDGVINIYFYENGTVNYRGNPKQINITGDGQVTDKNF